MSDQKTDTKQESRVVLPVDPTRRTEIDKQRVPMSARPYRLLALVKRDAVVRVQKEPDDTVMTWPHLLSIEFLAAGMMSILLLLMGLFGDQSTSSNSSPPININLWAGIGLIVTAVVFETWKRLRPVKVVEPPPGSDEAPRAAH